MRHWPEMSMNARCNHVSEKPAIFKGRSQTAEKEWKIEQSFQTMKECQEYLKDFISQQKKRYDAHAAVAENVEGNKGAITIDFNKQYEEQHIINLIKRDLICLPDTIDPRSPKR
jgi:hypothetical protein